MVEAFLSQAESRTVDIAVHVQTGSTNFEVKDKNNHVFVPLDCLEPFVYLG